MVGFAKLVVQTVAVVLDCTPAVQADRVAMTAIFGVSVESNPVHASSLLSKGEQMGTTIGCVVPIVPSASVDTEGRHIRSS